MNTTHHLFCPVEHSYGEVEELENYPQLTIVLCVAIPDNKRTAKRIAVYQNWFEDQFNDTKKTFTLCFSLKQVLSGADLEDTVLIYVPPNELDYVSTIVSYASETSDGARVHDLTLIDIMC